MPTSRRKLSAVLNDFCEEIARLERYDRENQAKFSTSVGVRISKKQLHTLTEAIFFAGFRAYENFMRDIFLLYCMEKQPRSGTRVNSYLKPKDFEHAEQLIKSSMRFLDWSTPTQVIDRAERYLKDGNPIKIPISTNLQALTGYKRIRNHIAHNSKESMDDYKTVLRNHYGTIPTTIPSPGEYLLQPESGNPHRYKLLTFFDLMKKLAQDLT